MLLDKESKAVDEQKIDDEVVTVPEDDDIVDIDLSATKKKRFRIDGDNNRILYLNTSDFGVISRLKDTYPTLADLASQVGAEGFDFGEDDEDELVKLTKASHVIDTIDKKMREGIDYIFDSNVSEICAPDGTMYDLFNGKFRFEHIIEKLANLYNTQVSKEYRKMFARLKKHTSKYTG